MEVDITCLINWRKFCQRN